MAATIQNGELTSVKETPYRLGMWVALASIAMLFTSLSSAYIVRAAAANDWYPLAMPRVLLLSSAIILLSSGSLEMARRKLKASMVSGYSRWLLFSALLGFSFLVTQFMAWRQLRAQGIYLGTNPHSSFFYLLSGVHALHLIGGLLGLLYLLVRTRSLVRQATVETSHRAVADAVSIYWHFMDVLWIYLFLLLFFWR